MLFPSRCLTSPCTPITAGLTPSIRSADRRCTTSLAVSISAAAAISRCALTVCCSVIADCRATRAASGNWSPSIPGRMVDLARSLRLGLEATLFPKFRPIPPPTARHSTAIRSTRSSGFRQALMAIRRHTICTTPSVTAGAHIMAESLPRGYTGQTRPTVRRHLSPDCLGGELAKSPWVQAPRRSASSLAWNR